MVAVDKRLYGMAIRRDLTFPDSEKGYALRSELSWTH